MSARGIWQGEQSKANPCDAMEQLIETEPIKKLRAVTAISFGFCSTILRHPPYSSGQISQ